MNQIEKLTEAGIVNEGQLDRMKKLMERASNGEELVIGFIGGSITQGALSSTPKTCYAYLVYQWWVTQYPQASFKYVNAGIGGTPSYYGVSRVDKHLLVHKPDFVIVEFSVNDKDDEFFEETYEGLIRNILYSKTNPAVMVINNMFYNDGSNAQNSHNRVAKAYGLPIFSVKDSIYAQIENGYLNATDLTPDDLHPNDRGHQLIADLVSNFLSKIEAKVSQVSIYSLDENRKATTKNRFETATRIQNYNFEPCLNGFVKDERPQEDIRDNFKRGWCASNLGDSISFELTCQSLGIQYLKTIHKPAPIVKLVIDHNEAEAIILDANFLETWGDSLRSEFVTYFEDDKMHHIHIEIIEIDENNKTPFYLVGLITT